MTEADVDEMEMRIQSRIAARIAEVDMEENPNDYGPLTSMTIRENAKQAKNALSAWVRKSVTGS